MFIPYTPTVFLLSFINSTKLFWDIIWDYWPSLYQNQTGEIRPIKTHLGTTTHSGDLSFKGTLLSITLDENQHLTIKFNPSYEVWSEGPTKKAK